MQIVNIFGSSTWHDENVVEKFTENLRKYEQWAFETRKKDMDIA